jgi:hypothetical protein
MTAPSCRAAAGIVAAISASQTGTSPALRRGGYQGQSPWLVSRRAASVERERRWKTKFISQLADDLPHEWSRVGLSGIFASGGLKNDRHDGASWLAPPPPLHRSFAPGLARPFVVSSGGLSAAALPPLRSGPHATEQLNGFHTKSPSMPRNPACSTRCPRRMGLRGGTPRRSRE